MHRLSGYKALVTDEQPEWMPMFPWYSGTSADIYRTMFDLLISVKLFLGRFDMRTMQVKRPPRFPLGTPHTHLL